MRNAHKRNIRAAFGERVFDAANGLFLFLLMAVTLYPLLYVLFASMSDPSRLAMHQGLLLFPDGFSLEAYGAVAQNPMIGRGYWNTLVIMSMGTLLNLFMTSLGAFVLSRRNLPYKKGMALLILFTMFFSGGLIPRYLIVTGLGLLDSFLAILLPTAINTYNMIVMRTSFESIPESLEESAAIDGANDFIVLARIVLPLSMPVVAVMLLFYGVSHWNSWFSAMIYLRTRTKFPLQLILREILITNSLDSMTTNVGSLDKEPIGETIKYATIVVATIPVLVIYPFLQKYFTKGMLIGAIKA